MTIMLWTDLYKEFPDSYVNPSPMMSKTWDRIGEKSWEGTTVETYYPEMEEAGFLYHAQGAKGSGLVHMEVYIAILDGVYDPLRGKWTIYSGHNGVTSSFTDEHDALMFSLRMNP